MAVIAICWSLWLERNNRIFEDVSSESDFIWDRVKYWVALCLHDSRYFKELSFLIYVEIGRCGCNIFGLVDDISSFFVFLSPFEI